MGGWVSRLTSLVWAKKEIRILILGLVRLPQRHGLFLRRS